ncbi:MAG: N-acetylglucosamine kinase [Acidimicrobiales bacterium]
MDWLRAMPSFPEIGGIVVVDGGGTRSRAALASADGELLGYAEGGPTNSRSAGDDEAAANVEAVIADAMAQAGSGSGPVTAVLVTSASVDTQAHADLLIGGVRRTVPTEATVAAVADTLGCWAATAAMKPAVAVIAGTGSSVLAASLSQGSRRFGGWDYVLGDEGSGFAIGAAALRETLLVAERRSDATALAEACRARLGITEIDELFDRVYKPEVDKASVAAFAVDVFELTATGDENATGLLAAEAARLAATVAAAFDQFDDLGTLGCFGGIWNDDGYRRLFGEALGAQGVDLPKIVRPGDTAMAGAVRIVLRHHGEGESMGEDPEPDENAAVARFTDALIQAKAAVEEGRDHAAGSVGSHG